MVIISLLFVLFCFSLYIAIWLNNARIWTFCYFSLSFVIGFFFVFLYSHNWETRDIFFLSISCFKKYNSCFNFLPSCKYKAYFYYVVVKWGVAGKVWVFVRLDKPLILFTDLGSKWLWVILLFIHQYISYAISMIYIVKGVLNQAQCLSVCIWIYYGDCVKYIQKQWITTFGIEINLFA